MSGSKLSVAREVTYELGDWRPLLDEGGEIQEVIVIGEEVGTDGAIDVEVGVQVGVGEAASVGEPRCSMGVEGDKGVQVGSGGEALKAQLGLENGQRRHGRGNMGTTKGEVPWAPLGEMLRASTGGCADHGEGIAAWPGEFAGEWAVLARSSMLGEPRTTTMDARHRAVQVQEVGTSRVRCHEGARQELGAKR
ncbi:unnamed protein product [Ilex paraguariensis]|uniref:Uncharacterized protein n=1 Tax=Ilex paraguariensis TaxID=185542 RepID=A0ABC8UF52_9AQUA